jgi:hypothetical protein
LVDITPKESAGESSNGADADGNEEGAPVSPAPPPDPSQPPLPTPVRGEQKSRQPSHDINYGEELSVAVFVNNEVAANTFTRYTSEG